MTTQDILRECKVEGQVVKLPPRNLPRHEYMDVKKALEGIGGKWKGGKVAGFVFAQPNPKPLLDRLCGGEKVHLKRDFQFFATPPDVADMLVELACIDTGRKNLNILEPSAGQGAIVEAINRAIPGQPVNCYELMDVNRAALEQVPNAIVIGDDFMTPTVRRFDYIIANPPFTKNQDIDHIRKMYEHLAPGGIMVSIASTHWVHSQNKKESLFRAWLDEVGAETQELPPGTFKESGTNVGAFIIKIRK